MLALARKMVGALEWFGCPGWSNCLGLASMSMPRNLERVWAGATGPHCEFETITVALALQLWKKIISSSQVMVYIDKEGVNFFCTDQRVF